MEPTAVTAVVTTRNRLGMLPRTLGAILGQQGVEMRLVVVDEGSSDGTAEFLAAIRDPRVSVVRHDAPLGVSGARNAGIGRATTRWVAICDDDDLWSPVKVARQLDALAARPDASWALAEAIVVDDAGLVVGCRELTEGGDILPALLVANVTPTTSGFLFDVDLFAEAGRFEVGMNESEDWDLAIRLAQRSPVAIAHGPLVAYRASASGLSGNLDRMRASFELIRTRYAALAADRGVIADGAGHQRYLARQAVKAGARGLAFRSFARLGWAERDPADVVRAFSALVAPRWMDAKGDARAVARIPTGWAAEAQRWMRSIDELTVPSGDDSGPLAAR